MYPKWCLCQFLCFDDWLFTLVMDGGDQRKLQQRHVAKKSNYVTKIRRDQLLELEISIYEKPVILILSLYLGIKCNLNSFK